MSGRTAPFRLATAGIELCRLTVQTPVRRCDVALPASASIGELLPLVLGEMNLTAEPDTWVIQRLGGPVLDPGATPESLGLGDGATLYVNPVDAPMPEAEFDDVSVGVAEIIGARGDQWRPEFTRYMLLAAGIVASGTLCAVAVGARSQPTGAWWCVVAAVGLTVWAVIAGVVLRDRATAVACGLGGCVAGALTGLALANSGTALLTMNHRSVLLSGLCAFIPAVVTAAASRAAAGLCGTIAAWSAAAALGAILVSGLGWEAAQSAAVLAVFMYAVGARGVRTVLRFARLRAPLLPHTASELQQDIEPESHGTLAARSVRAVTYLNVLFITTAMLADVACVLLAQENGWIGWTLALVLSAAVLLRSRVVTSAWQRAPLALAGLIGLAAVVAVRTADAGSATRLLVLLGMMVATGGFYAAMRLMPGRRTLPVWGHVADLVETWTAVALVPLLLQLFHLYAHIRAQIN